MYAHEAIEIFTLTIKLRLKYDLKQRSNFESTWDEYSANLQATASRVDA